MCILVFVGAFLNSAGNTVFNASMMLALPEENRGAILGFIQAASVGGSALSALIYGLLGEVFPLYLVFTVGTALSMIPMVYMCIHPKTREFILSH
jgi:MFS family permease